VKTLHVRRKGDMATLQFLTQIIDIREQSVRLTQCIHVYTFDGEWPAASVRACARSIDDHRDPFAAHKGIYLELNVAAMRRKGKERYEHLSWLGSVRRVSSGLLRCLYSGCFE